MKLRVKIAAVASAVALSIVGWAIPANAGEYTGMRVLQAVQKEVNDLTSPEEADGAGDDASQDAPPDESSPPESSDDADASSDGSKEKPAEDSPAPAPKEPAKEEEPAPAKDEAPADEEAPAKDESPASEDVEPKEAKKSSEAPATEEPAKEEEPEAPAQRSTSSNTNEPAAQGGLGYDLEDVIAGAPHPVTQQQCYKYEDGKPGFSSNAHARVSQDGKSVKLKEWDENWPDGHYEILIVKGSNGANVYYEPNVGQWYKSPLKNGKTPEISHYVVCKTYTPEETDVCENWDGKQATVPEGMQSDGKGNCWYEVYVCWEITEGTAGLEPGYRAPVDRSNFPQRWAAEGTSYEEVIASEECAPQPMCDDSTWWQIDKYKIDSDRKESTLNGLRSTKTLNWPAGGDPDDTTLWNPEQIHWIVQKTGTEDCTNSGTVDLCQPNGQGGYSLVTTTWNYDKRAGDGNEVTFSPAIAEGSLHPFIEIRDHKGAVFRTIEASDFDGDLAAFIANDCEPPVIDLCDNFEGVQAELPAGWYVKNNGDCAYDVFVCWEIKANVTGQPSDGAAYLFDPKQELKQYLFQDAEGSVTLFSLTECWDFVPECGTTTWFQLDHYVIDSKADQDLIDRLLADGKLGWDGGPEDASIYANHVFVQRNGTDCTNSGTVDVCLPDDSRASGLAPGTISWSYTKNANGTVTVTTDPADLAGVIHDGFTILTHHEPAQEHSTVASTWEGAGTFAQFRDNGCQTDVDICVPADTQQERSATPSGPTNPWAVMTVTEQERADDYPNAAEPNAQGFCDFEIYICWEIKGGIDLLAWTGAAGAKNPVYVANFSPTPQEYVGWGTSFDDLKDLEDCAPEPICGDVTAFQLDKYDIASTEDWDTLLSLIANGLGMDGGSYGDHTIYGGDHLIIKQDAEDCVKTGTVPVCLPGESASRLVQGLMTWTYTKTSDGEGYTTDYDGPHPAFTVTTHLDEPFENVAAHADWNQAYYDNGCQTDVDICVPAEGMQELALVALESPSGATNPWMVITVTEQEAADDYPNAFAPNAQGFCEYQVFVCWEIQAEIDGTPTDGAAYLFDPEQQLVQYVYQNADGTLDFSSLTDCYDDTPRCGDDTWYQLDLYTINSESDHALLDHLLSTGELGYNGSPEDSQIYTDHVFVKRAGQDCTKTGTVPVCIPDEGSASGYVQGILTWTYTKTLEGESFTTDFDGPHPAYAVTTHLDELFENVAAHDDWDQAYYDNGCQGDVDICVPVDGQQQAAAATTNGPVGPTNPWMVITVTENDAKELYPNAFAPNKKGYCEFEVFVCWKINGGVDLLATTGPAGAKVGVYKANFTPDKQTYVGWGTSFDALKALEDCAPEPVCGEMTAFQLDKYTIASTGHYTTLMELIANGLGMDGSKYADHALYKDHLIIKQVAEPCVNSGTVEVCVPDESTASGYSAAVVTWNYSKAADGTVTVSTDPADLTGYLHAGFDVLTHEEPATVHSSVAATWTGDGAFAEFYDNGCQGDVDICVPAGDNVHDDVRVIANTNRGYVVKTVTEQEFEDIYSDYPLPVDGACPDSKGSVTICHNNNGVKDFVAITVSWHAIGNKITGFNAGQFTGNGHGSDNGVHDEDIIPPFIVTYANGDVLLDYPGKNWDGFTSESFAKFVKNGCKPLTEICPVDLDGNASDWEPVELFSWQYKPAKHTLWTGDPEDCFEPFGFTQVCYPNKFAKDGWSTATIKWWANWTSEDDWSFRGFWLLGTAPFDEADEILPGWSLESLGVVVPPIDSDHYGVAVDHAGVNWTPLNQAIYNTGCNPVPQIVDVNHENVTCENPEAGEIHASFRAATGDGTVELRLYRVEDVEGVATKTYLNPNGTRATRGLTPVVHNIADDGALTQFDVTGLPHGDYVLETVNAAQQEVYGAAFTIERPEGECASIDPDVLSGICVDGIPYLEFTIALEDKFEEVDLSEGARFTLTDDVDPSLTAMLETIPLAKSTQGGVTYSYDASSMTHTWTGRVLWPGASDVEPLQWPGWAQQADGTYVNVGTDNFGWTRDGMDVLLEVNPSVEFSVDAYPTEGFDCPNPPEYSMCVWDEANGVPVQTTVHGTIPEGFEEWDGGAECTPVPICVLEDAETDTYGMEVIMASELDEEIHQIWNDEAEFMGGCREAQEPALDGSLFTSVCLADSPWLDYEVALFDPDNQYDGDGTVTITFVNPDGDDYVMTDDNLKLNEDGTLVGRALWPGASVGPADGLSEGDIDPYDAGTFVPTGWPGWHQDADGNWFEDASPQDNFGWTRNGVEVRIEVNPELTVVLDYPPATPECAGNPPQNPSVAGSVLNSVCVADSPWLTYDVELVDPDDVSTDDGTATITFVHPTDEAQNVVVEVPIGQGYVMWPGASVAPADGYTEEDIDPTDPATFVPTGWPGWAQDASGEWVSIGLENYGWTRYGIEVRLEVNPSTSLTVNYPPPTPTCVSSPVQTVSTNAPAATPVSAAVITYTG